MPGPSVHYIVGQQLFRGNNQPPFIASPDLESAYFNSEIRELLRAHQTFLNIGTLGPDFLFFNVEDWPYASVLPVKCMIKVAEIMKEVEGYVEGAFPLFTDLKELKDELDRAEEEVLEESVTLRNIRRVHGDVQELLELMSSIVSTAIQDFITSNIDVFSLVSHPLQTCDEKNNWWWFDILHYRRTGKFAKYLLENSRHDPRLHAYAIGYLSHVAADGVGHPYVNNIVRGPFRTYSQRHNVVEKFQDVSALHQYAGQDFSTSKLHEQFKLNFSEHNRIPDVESIIDNLTPGLVDIGLPRGLSELFSNATKEVYKDEDGNAIFGKHMEPEEVDAAYRLWYSWFKASTEEAILPPSLPDMPPLSEEIREIYEDFLSKISASADEIGDILDSFNPSWGFNPENIVNFFQNLIRVITELVKIAATLLDLLIGAVVAIGARAFHFMLNEVYKAFYAVYDMFRLHLSLNGMAFPSVRYLNNNMVQHMLNPTLPDSLGNVVQRSWPYPLRKLDIANGIFVHASQEARLVYPNAEEELDGCTAGPDSYCEQPHHYFIEGDINLNPEFINAINSITDFDRLKLETKTEQLGNACDLTSYFYQRFVNGDEIPDLNLDADRGVGYPCWESESCTEDGEIQEPVQPIVKL